MENISARILNLEWRINSTIITLDNKVKIALQEYLPRDCEKLKYRLVACTGDDATGWHIRVMSMGLPANVPRELYGHSFEQHAYGTA
jgi:hypothetical protein